MSLKLATKADATVVAGLFKELFDASIYSSFSTYKSEDVERIVTTTVDGDPLHGSCILLVEGQETVGALLCSVLPHLFNQSEKTAVEIGFWIKPEHRSLANMKKILGAYKYWARIAGCKTIMYGKVKSNKTTEEYIIRKLS